MTFISSRDAQLPVSGAPVPRTDDCGRLADAKHLDYLSWWRVQFPNPDLAKELTPTSLVTRQEFAACTP